MLVALNWIRANFTTLLVAACAILFMQWRDAEDEADAAQRALANQVKITEAQGRISEHAQATDNTTRVIIERVMESPNANLLVPPDLADAWLDGIERLRNDNGYTAKPNDDVSGPSGNDAGEKRTDDGRVDSNIGFTGSSILEV